MCYCNLSPQCLSSHSSPLDVLVVLPPECAACYDSELWWFSDVFTLSAFFFTCLTHLFCVLAADKVNSVLFLVFCLFWVKLCFNILLLFLESSTSAWGCFSKIRTKYVNLSLCFSFFLLKVQLSFPRHISVSLFLFTFFTFCPSHFPSLFSVCFCLLSLAVVTLCLLLIFMSSLFSFCPSLLYDVALFCLLDDTLTVQI